MHNYCVLLYAYAIYIFPFHAFLPLFFWLRRGRRQNGIDKCFVLLLDAMAEGGLKRITSNNTASVGSLKPVVVHFELSLKYIYTLRRSVHVIFFYPSFLLMPPVSVHLSVCVPLLHSIHVSLLDLSLFVSVYSVDVSLRRTHFYNTIFFTLFFSFLQYYFL